MRISGRAINLAAVIVFLLASAPAGAFKIDPWSYRPFGVSPRGVESQLETFFHNPRMLILGPIAFGVRVPAAMAQLTEPVHENLTELSIRCARAPLLRTSAEQPTGVVTGTSGIGAAMLDNMITRCAGRSGDMLSQASDLSEDLQEIIRATRFNDAPPIQTARALTMLVTPSALICGEVRVPENAACWAMLMSHAAGLAASDPGNAEFSRNGNILYRSHFGDMQFMHAMAVRGETLARSRERILFWAQFTYQVASGEIATESTIGMLPQFAAILGGFEAVTVAEFFEIRGSTDPEKIRRIALGALLHTIQDSFSEAHAEREAAGATRFGPIRAFHEFTCQSDEKHDAADRAAHYSWFTATTHEELGPITIGAQVLDLLERKFKWESPLGKGAPSVALYMRESVFPIVAANAAKLAGAGAPFIRTKPAIAIAPISSAQADDTAAHAAAADCNE